ncbi:chemotaxis protein CheB [Chryseobacterium sp. MP_3.2]|uniref:chemotaxis protein CheB n=1 Tax=Chryseobacterium sp. MP_3.2 TaxID=3071712 RepID=UPI002E01B35A|nr:two-component system chemotaxis response regulator CheB [Chryseobacterium sp. MP_3.2]
MRKCEALIIGGSAGSLDIILKLLPDLRTDLNFPIIIVLHRKSGRSSMLTDLLSARTKLKVKEIEEKEEIKSATIYLAPPSYHLLLENDRTFSLDASEKINFSRPSIDVTFESAAEIFKENLVCLLLSGANSDGTLGLDAVTKTGGKTAIQDLKSATSPFMPQNALENVTIDEILEPKNMANFINNLGR